ncbi:MAG: EAL domain-containing protein [Pseudobutyrivibrio sp.]|nr:EAL domain-containing protein [Pseudobutyrivibrio sp.]
MSTLNGFNVAAEGISLVLAIIMVYLAIATRPKKSRGFYIFLAGGIVSCINMVFHIALIVFLRGAVIIKSLPYRLLVSGYYITYLIILLMIFSYAFGLAYRGKGSTGSLVIFCFSFSTVYLVVAAIIIASGTYMHIIGNFVRLSNHFYFNVVFGILDAVAIGLMTIHNKEMIPQVVRRYVGVSFFAEIILLLAQLYQPRTVFLGITFVLPLLLCYILFHASIFDELTGCQGKPALENHFNQVSKKCKGCTVIYVRFPRLQNDGNSRLRETMKTMTSMEARKLERANHDAIAYLIDGSTFAVIFENRDDKLTEYTIDAILKSLNNAMDEWKFSNRPEYRMAVIGPEITVSTFSAMESLISYLFEEADIRKSWFIRATEDDYAAAMQRRRIQEEIIDIRNKGNLDDERVVVYVQPIYDVNQKSYRTAEALMRLEVAGEIIYPQTFVPLAESMGCIHTLTRIILNKVCRQVYLMQDYYDFDAISVNVSLSEFMDYDLHDELLEIIEHNGISSEKIRLEMTESMTSAEIDAITHNMREFNKAGIHFYLDDFGTGYSNLERIISLPFKTIKFDKSLLYKSEDDPILRQLIVNMVEVFKSHGMVVLIEGVETDNQSDISVEIGFEYIQGFKYAMPLPINDVVNFFDKKVG